MFHIKQSKKKEADQNDKEEDLGKLLQIRSQFSIEALTRKALMQQADLIEQLKAKLLAAANSGLDHCDVAWQTLLSIDEINSVTQQTFDDQQCFQLFSAFLTKLLNTRIISIEPVESNTLTIRFSWRNEKQISKENECAFAEQAILPQQVTEKSASTKKKSLLYDNFSTTDFNYRFAASTDQETQGKRFEQSISYF